MNGIWPIIIFILVIPAGTVIHEMGHYTVAYLLDSDPIIHFSSCDWNTNNTYPSKWHELTFIAGGILFPSLLSLFGVLLLYFRRHLTLAWQTFFLVLATFSFRGFFIIALFIYSSFSDSEYSTDESRINEILALPAGTFEIASVLFSCIISIAIYRKLNQSAASVLPLTLKMSLGIILGFGLWFRYLGPFLLP